MEKCCRGTRKGVITDPSVSVRKKDGGISVTQGIFILPKFYYLFV
jgi:hypothetical protein